MFNYYFNAIVNLLLNRNTNTNETEYLYQNNTFIKNKNLLFLN